MQPASATSLHAPPPSSRLAGLDALRGIAALCVLNFHAFSFFGTDLAFDGKGYLAVDFFFMLSGYVMARTYEHRLAEGYGARRFMIARYRRLWPVMAIGTLLGTPMLLNQLGDPLTVGAVTIANLLLIPVFTTRFIFPTNAAAWSIFAELLVNLAHGLLLWRWRTRSIALLAAAALPLLAWIAITAGNLDVGASAATAYAGPVRAIVAYCAGIVLWRLWRDRAPFRISPMLVFAAMPVLTALSQILRLDGWYYDLAFVVIACPLLIAGGLAYQGDHRIGRWLGMLSFPLYAVNLPLLEISREFGLGPLPGIGCALLLAAYIAWRSTLPRPLARGLAGA